MSQRSTLENCATTITHNNVFTEEIEEEIIIDEDDSFLCKLIIIQLLQEILKELMTKTTAERVQRVQ